MVPVLLPCNASSKINRTYRLATGSRISLWQSFGSGRNPNGRYPPRYVPLREESRRLEIASDNVYGIFRKTNEMKSNLAWKREWEAKVREKARQEQARQEQRERQPKRKKCSYDMSL